MFDVTKIKLSPKARIKTLRLPTEPSQDLAYFCGLLAGDGHIGVYAHKADYYLELAGNPADERELYNHVVVPLVQHLFNINAIPRLFKGKTYGICIRSKALIQYLVDVLGLPKNRKYSQLRIPPWIKCDETLVKAYIRGLADTDFCLSLKRRHKQAQYYPVVSGNSESKAFIDEIAQELETFGFVVSRHYDYNYPDPRLKSGTYTHHQIALYGHTQLAKWMEIIGFSSPKHLAKFKTWQERNALSNRNKTTEAVAASRKIKGPEKPLMV